MRYAEAHLLHRLEGHADSLYALDLGPEESLFTAGAEGVVIQWDLRSGQPVRPLLKTDGAIYSLSYRPDNQLLAVGRSDGGIYLVDVTARRVLGSRQAHQMGVFGFAWEEAWLIAAGGDGAISRWTLPEFRADFRLQLSPKALRTVTWSSSTNRFAVGGSDGYIRLLSPSLEVTEDFLAHSSTVFSLAFSPDGEYLFSAGRDALLKRWALADGFKLQEEVPAHLRAIQHLALSPDGKFLATASMDKTIKLWWAEDLTLLKVIDNARSHGHTHAVNRIAWLPLRAGTPRRLVSCGDDRKAFVWEVMFRSETIS